MALSFLMFLQMTRHSRVDSPGRVTISSQRLLPDDTKHSQHVLDRAATGTGHIAITFTVKPCRMFLPSRPYSVESLEGRYVLVIAVKTVM